MIPLLTRIPDLNDESSAPNFGRSAPSGAVFLSYASQDAEVARRIAAVLRAAGVEVWFDQSELRGGDAWDAAIRKQIRECALFVPVISANTQSRAEGYFRLEWRIADQRTHQMSRNRAFLLPVCVDDTRDAEADVPDSFVAVQWTRLPGGEAPPAFAERVQRLLHGEAVGSSGTGHAGSAAAITPRQASRPTRPVRPWLFPVVLGVVVLASVAAWQARQVAAIHDSGVSVVVPGEVPELARLRARIIPDRWQKGDYDAIAATLDRLIQANPENAEAWALRSLINSLQVVRLIDPGTKPLELGRSAAEHALRLAPDSPHANLALGLHLVAMVSRGGDPLACREPMDRALAALPPDALTRYAGLVSYWLGYDFERTERFALDWLEAEPGASYPAWILASKGVSMRQPFETERWARLSIDDLGITGVRTRLNLAEVNFYMRADPVASRKALDGVPIGYRSVARVVHWRWLQAMIEERWDAALQELAQVPEPMLFDVAYNGPKALLAGLAHQRAGRREPAATQFREAERLSRENLAGDPDNEAMRLALAVTLASAGRAAEARSELALVEPLVRERAPNIYRARLVVGIAQTYGALGEHAHMATWIRRLFAEPSSLPLTPASFRLDPRFNAAVAAPEIKSLLAEFAGLDRPAAASGP